MRSFTWCYIDDSIETTAHREKFRLHPQWLAQDQAIQHVLVVKQQAEMLNRHCPIGDKYL